MSFLLLQPLIQQGIHPSLTETSAEMSAAIKGGGVRSYYNLK